MPVPKLRELCEKVLRANNPHAFFRLHNLALPPSTEILVDEVVQPVIEKHAAIYQFNNANRMKEVNIKTAALRNDCCLKTFMFFGGVVVTGVYLGIGYPILQAVDASGYDQTIFYSLAPVAFVCGNFLTACFLGKGTRLMANCLVPKTKIEVIDFNIEANLSHNQQPIKNDPIQQGNVAKSSQARSLREEEETGGPSPGSSSSDEENNSSLPRMRKG